MKTREQIKKDVLAMPIGDILDHLKEGMETANKHGDICATVLFATQINFLETLVGTFVDLDEETDNLFTEG